MTVSKRFKTFFKQKRSETAMKRSKRQWNVNANCQERGTVGNVHVLDLERSKRL